MFEFLHFREFEVEAIQLSLKVSLYCILLSLVPAISLGYRLSRSAFKEKVLLESFLNLPLVLPPVTTGYLLLVLFGVNGLFGSLLSQLGIRLSFSFNATVMASIVVSFPLMLRVIKTSFDMIDVGLEEASRTLGRSRWETFRRVSLPLALPGVISGAVLGFARSLGEFGATIMFAGNIPGETQTIPLAIYSQMQVPNGEGTGFRLVLISVIIAFLAIILSEWFVYRTKSKNF